MLNMDWDVFIVSCLVGIITADIIIYPFLIYCMQRSVKESAMIVTAINCFVALLVVVVVCQAFLIEAVFT